MVPCCPKGLNRCHRNILPVSGLQLRKKELKQLAISLSETSMLSLHLIPLIQVCLPLFGKMVLKVAHNFCESLPASLGLSLKCCFLNLQARMLREVLRCLKLSKSDSDFDFSALSLTFLVFSLNSIYSD